MFVKNGKWKVVKTNLHVWFNKVCRIKNLSPTFTFFLNIKNAVHGTVCSIGTAGLQANQKGLE
jgi:hypothetical protein